MVEEGLTKTARVLGNSLSMERGEKVLCSLGRLKIERKHAKLGHYKNSRKKEIGIFTS